MIVDASVWVSGVTPNEVHHLASRDWLRAQVDKDAWLAAPILALAEVAGAIARRTGSPELGRRAALDLARVPVLRLIPVDDQLGREVAEIAATLQLRGADAVYVAVARSLGVALVSWDGEMLQRAGAVVEVLRP